MIIKYLRSVFKEEPYAGLFDISLHKDNKTKIYRYINNHAVINRKVPLPEAPCGLRGCKNKHTPFPGQMS